MNSIISDPASSTTRRAKRQAERTSHGARRRRVPQASIGPSARSPRQPTAAQQTLSRYIDLCGRRREIVARAGAGGSVLVLDRDAVTLDDRRLLAHIAADEPAGNVELVGRRFLEQARREHCVCRALNAEDFETIPFGEEPKFASEPRPGSTDGSMQDGPCDRLGRKYGIERFDTGMTVPELRWSRHCAGSSERELHVLSLRDVIAGLERYEPACALTRQTLTRHDGDGTVSIVLLRAELRRMEQSPIVLNRGLRAAALDSIKRRGCSMSEIAMRCGRIKRDAAGNESGETSWLARRIGLLPEGGRSEPTPWIHSDVLALIARDGLGLSPHEVEVG